MTEERETFFVVHEALVEEYFTKAILPGVCSEEGV